MILVLLGTFVTDFKRPLIEIEKLCADGTISEEVFVQAGYTTITDSEHIIIKPFIEPDELTELHNKARIIITHAGVGSIMKALFLKKKVIAIARLSKYDEHVDDHQVEVLEEFARLNYLMPWRENDSLKTLLANADDFNQREFISNNSQMISYLTKYIDSL